MRMVRKSLNLLVDEQLVKKARNHGLNLSKFFENQLRGYFNFIEGKHQNYYHSDNDEKDIEPKRRGRDLNSRSPEGEPALKAGAVGRTLLPRQKY